MSDIDTNDIDRGHLRLLEAILFAAAEPLQERALAQRLPDGADLAALLARLREDYAERGVNLIQAGKAWAFRTAPDLSAQLTAEIEVSRKLSRAAIETLAIIAYHQPVTRAEIEEIRGVGLSKGTLDALFDQGWIRPLGRRRTPGRPTTWGTTDRFLDHFGLESLKDLPGIAELKAAGLLDTRPAVEAYRVRGSVDPQRPAEEGADGEAAPEPLDPDDGDSEAVEKDFFEPNDVG